MKYSIINKTFFLCSFTSFVCASFFIAFDYFYFKNELFSLASLISIGFIFICSGLSFVFLYYFLLMPIRSIVRELSDDEYLLGRKINVSRKINFLRVDTDEIDLLLKEINIVRKEARNNLLEVKYINKYLEKKVFERTKKLEEALEGLKSAQDSVIQQKKLSSLNDLSAGIAHEIKNPLNLINNSSLIVNTFIKSLEKLVELDEVNFSNLEDGKKIKKELSKVLRCMSIIRNNVLKADKVIMSMLLLSGRGDESLTSINLLELVKTHVDLAEKSFVKTKNITFQIKYNLEDDKIYPIHAFPRDLGRLIICICDNAFYSMCENPQTDYVPTLNITLRRLGKSFVEIRVRDNGKGISEKLLEKVFDPFFTTKDTSSGVGLGLSICSDIIKAHCGDLRVESKEGIYTEFIISIPTDLDERNIHSKAC